MTRDWSDLLPRIVTSAMLLGIGAVALIFGGYAFVGLSILVGAFVAFELYRMSGPARVALLMAGLAATVLAVWSLVWLRSDYGVISVLFVLGTVIVVDTTGYFAGRVLGGPLLYPIISPRKTWSGAIAGWFAALGLAWAMQQPLWLGPIFALVAQVGDLAESALKRAAGVNDSSGLLPGHGGVLDRFDGHIAVALLAGVLALFGIWPEGGL